MSSQQTRASDRFSGGGRSQRTHWSEDTDFSGAATEAARHGGSARSTARLTSTTCASPSRAEEVDAPAPRRPLPEADRLTRNNAVDDVARHLPLAHATLERIRAEAAHRVVGVDYDALCDAVEQLEATLPRRLLARG